MARLLIALARFTKMSTGSASSALEVLGELKSELKLLSKGSLEGSPPGTSDTLGGFWVGVCTEWRGE